MATITGNVNSGTGSVNTNTSLFVEVQSTVRPSFFNGSNYAYWARRIKFICNQ